MSLYRGIRFSAQGSAPTAAPSTSKPASTSAGAPAPTATSVATVTASREIQSGEKDADKSASRSSALAFVPKARKPAPARASAPVIKPAFLAAPAASIVAAGPRPLESSQDKSLSASTSVIKAPPTTLAPDSEDVNGFKQTDAGKRAAKKRARKYKKTQGAPDDPATLYRPGAEYDPRRPCDYASYKSYRAGVKQHERLERERQARRERSYSDSSYDDSEDDSEEERRRSRARLFAPPTSYGETRQSSSQPPEDEPHVFEPGPREPTPPLAAYLAPRNESGEDAYARRLAMWQQRGGQAARPPPPPQPAPQFEPSPQPAQSRASSVVSGEEAYQRRLAMSSGDPPAPPAPPAPTKVPSPPSAAALTQMTDAELDAMIFDDGLPPPAEEAAEAPVPAPELPPAVSEAQARAREIAAKLGKLGGPAPPANDPTKSFAENIMARYGWKEGRGLGANESGITSALSVEKSDGGKKKGKETETAAGPAPMKGRGTIVDDAREQRRQEQQKRYGEASKVVLLMNMCAPHEVDDELAGEVAEEARKQGAVERCLVHVVPFPTGPEDAVRVFLVMAGLSAAYNVRSSFDGRFFGGRTVRSRFYDESLFRNGQYDEAF